MAELPCCKADCPDMAEYVVTETHPLNCLFKSGAGLMCETHSAECLNIGGIRLPMGAFAQAIRENGKSK